jgi:hypothetical protein
LLADRADVAPIAAALGVGALLADRLDAVDSSGALGCVDSS